MKRVHEPPIENSPWSLAKMEFSTCGVSWSTIVLETFQYMEWPLYTEIILSKAMSPSV